MTDRDHFAAAALTGLLARNHAVGQRDHCFAAYRWADAMLCERERSRAGQNNSEGTDSAAKCTERDSANHDAAPAARAQDLCTGDTTEPVAWAVMDGHEFMEFCTDKEEAKCAAGFYGDCPIVPLYRHPPCQDFSQKNLTLTDAELEAVERGYCSLMGVEDRSAECSRWDAEAADTLRGLLERLG